MVQDTQRDETEPEKRPQRIRQVVEDCLRRRAEGESLSDESIIEAHPDLLPGLAEELRKLRLITAAWQKAEHGPSVDADAGTNRRRGLEVRCPHCQTPVEMVADTPFTEITCSTCGSSFSLAGNDTETRQAASITTIGHFELVERLGVGGFGTVWKARDTELDRTVTVKIPRAGQLEGLETEQFLREARAAAQLKHPNIVSVHEVGRDGETVYIVSDLVRGLSLADWLTGQRPTASEAAELCVKIAEALHHAHQAGVVHRDLKPANVMIDADGQPHIMDFGLAKRDAGEVTLTTDGQVLGTPAYMPPEQAEGKAHQVDGRSDVYSLGVILFELLTGERPFRGNARMLIHQVINEEPPSPRNLNGTIPRDLETICLKCMEKARDRRYGSAEDLAEELRRFLRGEPIHARPIGPAARVYRWCKRRPLVAGLSATAALLLVAVAVVAAVGYYREAAQRQIAQTREKEALRNFQMARDAVDKFFTQVSEDPRLRAHDLEKLRSSLLQTAREFYEQFVKHKPDDPKLRAEHGWAYFRLGEIGSVTGRREEAQDAFRAAVEIFERLAAEHPAVPDHLNGLAKSHHNLGFLYVDMDEIQKAEAEHRAARKIWERLAVKHPEVPEYQQMLAASHSNMATVYSRLGRATDAVAQAQAALKIMRELVQKHPRVPVCRRELARTHKYLGQQYEQVPEQYQQAEAEYLNAESILERLVEAPLALPEWKNDLAAVRLELGRWYSDNQRANEAGVKYQAACAVWSVLATEHPDIPEYSFNLAKGRHNLGTLYFDEPQLGKDPETEYLAALSLRKRLVDKYPNVPEYQSDLAQSHFNFGLLYASTDRPDKGETAYEEARSIYQLLVEQHPEIAAHQEALGKCRINLGILYGSADRASDAVAELQAARDIWMALSSKHPGSTEYQRRLAESHYNLGVLYAATRRVNEAEAAYKLAIDTWRPLRDVVRFKPGSQELLAKCYHDLGELYQRSGQPEEAEAAYRAQLAIRTRLADEHPNSPEYKTELGAHQYELGLFFQRSRQFKKAEEAYLGAIDTARRLTQKHPNASKFQNYLAETLMNLGVVYVDIDRPEEAEAAYCEAIKIWSHLAAKHPKLPEYRDDLARIHMNLGNLLWAIRRTDDAERAYRQALDIGTKLAAEYPSVPAYRANLAHYATSANDLVWYLVTSADVQLRRPARAVELAKKAVELAPDQAAFWNTLGVAHYRDANWQGAIEALERSLKLQGDNSLDFFFLAMARWQLGGKDEGRQCYQKAIESMEKNKPNDKELRRFRAEAEELMGVTKTSPTEKEKQTESQR